jgi:Uma2 family endonuclease
MGATTTKLMTFAEFEQLPDEVCRRHELRHGELVEVAEPKFNHSFIQRRLVQLLSSAGGADAFVTTEFGFRGLPEHEYRRADVAYISPERVAEARRADYFHGAPDLVIEVLSPSNTKAEMRDKAALCLANGCLEFWVLDEKKRQVSVSTPNGVTITYHSGQVIPLRLFGDASLAVDQIFEE